MNLIEIRVGCFGPEMLGPNDNIVDRGHQLFSKLGTTIDLRTAVGLNSAERAGKQSLAIGETHRIQVPLE